MRRPREIVQDLAQARDEAWLRVRVEVDARFHGMLGQSSAPYRTVEHRRRTARRRLARDRDAWLITRDDVVGGVYALPLSFLSTDAGLWFATKRHRRIAVNVTANPMVEVALGGYLDAIIVDGVCDPPTARPPIDVARRYAEKAGYTPNPVAQFVYLRVEPHRLRVSRSPKEFADRDVWTATTQPWATFVAGDA